jgi:hypothetical protein
MRRLDSSWISDLARASQHPLGPDYLHSKSIDERLDCQFADFYESRDGTGSASRFSVWTQLVLSKKDCGDYYLV